ncbi:NAD-dependent epimerase/dehydratase family protein [Bacteroidota bacterium]
MKVIITGATGMVGKGVLLECINNSEVNDVLSISRRKLGMKHPKLKELLHVDFSEFKSIKMFLNGYDACYACMGVSSAGINEELYSKLTYDYTLALAKELLELNPNITFTYVSGQGTDSSEKGKSMWARVKGKTENDLIKLGFKQTFMFRPGGIIPKQGVQPSSKVYRILIKNLKWLLYIIKVITPNSIVDTEQIGLAMINATKYGYNKNVLKPGDILELTKKNH